MSYCIPDDEKCDNVSQVSHAPPIRKLFSPTNSEDIRETDTFRVFLRIKPNSKLDQSNDCMKICNSTNIVCKPPSTSKFKKLDKVEYTFSHIFGPQTTQTEIFSKCIVNCVEDVLLGRNSLVFAYGTTNAGKTFTVQGSSKNPGIIPHVLYTLFSNINIDRRIEYRPHMAKDLVKLSSSTSHEECQTKNEILRSFQSETKSSKSTSSNNDPSHFMQALQKTFIELKCNKPRCSIWISFLEVYNEIIYDLLDSTVTASRRHLKLAVDGSDNFYVKGLKQFCVNSAEEAFTIYQFGKKNLNVACTKMNETSSRSHCIFNIHVINLDVKDQPIISKLSICDLAGTERLTKTQNTGMRLKECGNINGSLFQLNRCLRAIRDNQTKRTNQLIPYRYSNLTKLLHTALDDRSNERIVMIVNINPSAELYDETQQVLKMCAMAAKIKNKPIANKALTGSRFNTLVYGRNCGSLDEEHRSELSDLEEDLEEESEEVRGQALEVHELKEKLARVEEELRSSKIRESFLENTKKMLKEYCDKVENTYKNRVKTLEDRLKSQKKYYVWKVEDVKKNTIMENSFSEELSKKDVQIENLETKLLELQQSEGFRRLSYSEEIQEKEAKIKEYELLVQEAKQEYLLLEKKYKTDLAKFGELENELSDKNEVIENMENALNSKQNMVEEMEIKIERMQESLYNSTIEHEKILENLEKTRDAKVAAKNCEIEKLSLLIESQKQIIAELTHKIDMQCGAEQMDVENECQKLGVEKENTRPRRNNRTPLGNKVNQAPKTSARKTRAKQKIPVVILNDVLLTRECQPDKCIRSPRV